MFANAEARPSRTRRYRADAIRTIPRRHKIIEEGPDRIYGRCEPLPGIDADGVPAKLQVAPPVAMNPHVDNATAIESMRAAVQRTGYSFEF